jgi:hypothetical protein
MKPTFIIISIIYIYIYNYNYNETYNCSYNKTYNEFCIYSHSTVTYYKGVTTKLSANVTLSINVTSTAGTTKPIAGMIIGEMDLIDTSIEELKSALGLPSTPSLPLTTPFDFSVSTEGDSFKVAQGDSLTVPVSVSLNGGNPYIVFLSVGWITEREGEFGASNQWFTTEFNPSSGTPPFDSTLTIKVAENAPPGIYKARINAIGGGKAKDTIVTVNVVPALEIIDYSIWGLKNK